jgi:hypothetical protein
MPNEREIRELAPQALRANKLPGRDPDRTWGGRGVGAPCTICGEPVAPDQVEYARQFAHDAPGLDKYSLHIRCFAAWEMERTQPPALHSTSGHWLGLAGHISCQGACLWMP